MGDTTQALGPLTRLLLDGGAVVSGIVGDPLHLAVFGVGVFALFLLVRAFVRPPFALATTLLLLAGGALAYLLVVEPLAERFEAARGSTLRSVPFPELTRSAFSLPPLRERARQPRSGIAHLFTEQRTTFRYQLESDPTPVQADLLVIMNWQARYVGPAENPTRAVRQQLAATEGAIIRRIEAARAVGRPILVIGTTVAGVSDPPRETLFRARHPLGLQLTPAVRDALTDYDAAHYALTSSQGPLSQAGENRATRRAILDLLETRAVNAIRLTGAPEQLVVRHAGAQFLLDTGTGRTHTVLVSPAELADTDAVLAPELEPDVVYRSLPVYALTGALRLGEREVFLATQSAGTVTQLGSITTSDALDHF